MKTNRNIIECCNTTHQGAPSNGKQTCACASDLGDGSHVTCITRNDDDNDNDNTKSVKRGNARRFRAMWRTVCRKDVSLNVFARFR